MTKNNDSWKRLAQVIGISGLSTNSFAQHIGMSRSEGLYQIKSGRCSVTRHIADMVVDKYPQINKAWLLTGYGSMYADGSISEQVPFYDCPLSRVVEYETMQPRLYMHVPQVTSADLAVAYQDEDMMPLVPSGTTLFLRKVSPQDMLYGNEYVIVTAGWAAMRRVRLMSEPTSLRLEANDTSRFDDMVVQRDDIVAAFEVRAKLIVKNN